MKIVVNARMMLPNKMDGIGVFTYETMKSITETHPGHEYFFLFDRPFSTKYVFSDNVKPIVLKPAARHPILWYAWMEYSVFSVLKKIKPDVFIGSDGYIPLSSDTPSISVIHDINFYHKPKNLPLLTRWYYNYFFPRYAKKANKIITVSEHSKKDISQAYHVPPNKISVAYNGASAIFKPISEKNKISIRTEFSEGKNYFLFVGTILPRKNIKSLVLAFEKFKISTSKDFKLIIVGKQTSYSKSLLKEINQLSSKDDIIFAGRLNTADIHKLYCASTALTFVPYFEGFGIPILEAMQCETAVICSNITSLPEVAGDAVCYVDPHSINSISEGMIKTVEDSNYRDELIAKGRLHSRKFNWENTADIIWKSIEQFA